MKVLIEGMSHEHCVDSIKQVIIELAGVAGVKVRLDEQTAYIEGTPSEEEVKEAILQAGYDIINIE